ncbi:MAG: endopeptidase La [Bdellovibrionia bacterium]
MKTIPVLPIKSTVIYPGSAVPLRVGRTGSIAAVQKAYDTGRTILAVSEKVDTEGRDVTSNDLYSVGTLSKIEKLRGDPQNGYQILLRGISRYRVNSFENSENHIWADGDVWKEITDDDQSTHKALLGSLKTLAKEILELLPADTKQLAELVDGIEDLSFLAYLCASNLEIEKSLKQEVLETRAIRDRVLLLLGIMQNLKNSLEVQGEIREKLSQKMGKFQREAILREQLKTIREELGESEGQSLGGIGGGANKEEYRKKIDEAQMPEAVKKVALEELNRLEAVGNGSPETHVIRNYLDLLCALPWSKSSASSGANSSFEALDLTSARETLDRDHYGLEPIKKRVLQHLAVMKLKKSGRGQILLFVGPPGVGKTSLGQSIAKAMGRKFVRGSLGGVRDDAEIRGHRRTYIGAMPGRIIQGIKRAGENNPVFMLDEIDKLGRGFQGDPSAALLEVLDPEQNNTFLDHYLDVPFDLSKVFFIATANSLDSIPAPLLDRMEVVELSGYTTAEKLHIAKNHLIPKQLEEHGLTAEQLVLSDAGVLKVIHSYTREAGVRDLQRKIATLCRSLAEKVLEPNAELPVRVEVESLDELLGAERFVHEVAERLSPPGVATGLAWTPQGGEILFIEANLMPGKGQLILTGQLGDVMKESTQIALSLVRSRLAHLIPSFEFEKKDIHVHVPAGAIPKDGPSAGITMLTTIASLLTGRSVDSKLAMTGEVTLRGAVMPVGGIKEKVIAAHRSGIERVILSKRNQKDLRDVPEEVRSALKFEFVETATEVLNLALGLNEGGDFNAQSGSSSSDYSHKRQVAE